MPGNDIFWIDGITPVGAVLRATNTTSTLSLARFCHQHDTEIVLQANAEDAFVAIIHIGKTLPSQGNVHDNLSAQAAVPKTSFNFADLRSGPSCNISGRLDNFHLHIPRAAMDDLARDAQSPPIDRLHAPDGWQTDDPIVDTIKQTLITASLRPAETSRLFTDHLMLALHAHLARAYGGLREAGRRRRGGLAPWQERRAKESIAANLSQTQSLRDVADACRLSTAHFARAFKASTGMTPHGWMQGLRVDRARDLLATDLSLADIALDCGFADQSHFTRVFRQFAGDTPGAWRRYRKAA